MKNFIKITVMAVCALLVACALVACNNDADGGKGKSKEYVFEAEYTNLSGKRGTGYSDGAAETDMIMSKTTDAKGSSAASNGYFVGYLHCEISIEFEFTSDKAADAKIVMRLSSEMRDITLSPEKVGVLVNGEAINYGSLSLKGNAHPQEFYDKTFALKAQLKEGKNVISLVVYDNDYLNGETGGPCIDCLKVTTTAVLTWEPILANIA